MILSRPPSPLHGFIIIIIIIVIELYSTERRGGTSMRGENTDWWSATGYSPSTLKGSLVWFSVYSYIQFLDKDLILAMLNSFQQLTIARKWAS